MRKVYCLLSGRCSDAQMAIYCFPYFQPLIGVAFNAGTLEGGSAIGIVCLSICFSSLEHHEDVGNSRHQFFLTDVRHVIPLAAVPPYSMGKVDIFRCSKADTKSTVRIDLQQCRTLE